MKQFIVLICLAVSVAGCNNASTGTSATDSTATTGRPAAEVTLPFKLARPYRNWQMGSTENVVAAMGALKAFADKDFKALANGLGDSVELKFDYFHQTLSRDSTIVMFTAQRTLYNDYVITMYDYESVISADRKDEYVTIWYKQSWKDARGVADSVSVVNDCKMKNGKMIELDEKLQHFPKK